MCGSLGQYVEITHLQLIASGCFTPQNNALKFVGKTVFLTLDTDLSRVAKQIFTTEAAFETSISLCS